VDERRWWFDEEAGPVVRPYALTGGRTSTGDIELDLVTLVVAVGPSRSGPALDPTYARLLRLCEHPRSVAEAAAELDLPLRVVKVVLADLIRQQLMLHGAAEPSAVRLDTNTMRKVLDGLRAL
jgi:hypothetical protein